MIKYCLVFFSSILMFTYVDATSKKVHFSDDVEDSQKKAPLQKKVPSNLKFVMIELEGQAEQLQVEPRELPFDMVAKTIRVYLEGKPENSDGVSDEDYFALFKKVVNQIMP